MSAANLVATCAIEDHLVIIHASDEEPESDLGRIPQLCIRRCKAR